MFFYLNIEGWKVSAEQQLQAIELDFLKTGNSEKQVDLSINIIFEPDFKISYHFAPYLTKRSDLFMGYITNLAYPRVVTWIA